MKELLKTLNAEAQKLLNFGSPREKTIAYGMLQVLNKIKNKVKNP